MILGIGNMRFLQLPTLSPVLMIPSPFDDLYCESESESESSEPEQSRSPSMDSALIRVSEGETVYKEIQLKLVSSLNSHGINARLESVRRIDYTSDHPIIRARKMSFGLYSRAVGTKCGANAEAEIFKYAWFGACKDDIHATFADGFGCPNSDGTHGVGVYLSPLHVPAQSLEVALPDNDGLHHMLICRVILGIPEVVPPGSNQDNPSSEEFDSGVDNLLFPQKYIMWTSRMNTHILPEFFVSFRSCSCGIGLPRKEPRSKWLPLQNLINVLSKFLRPDALELIKMHHSDFKKQKITRFEMIQRMRLIAGDKLLLMILKSNKGKMKQTHRSSNFQQSSRRTQV